MAVYEHGYKPYTGALTPEWSRFLVIPRHAFRDVFRSKLFVAFFALCFIYPLVAAILIYLHHNVNALQLMKLDLRELVRIDAWFFLTFVVVQGTLAFFVNLLVGPPLVSRDLANNALPLYLCRPFARGEYVLGKMTVLLALLSLVTWVPGLLLFLLEAYLEGVGWFFANLRIGAAIFVGSAVWIVALALLSLAISAWVKWRVVAGAALMALFFIPTIFAEVVEKLFYTRYGFLLSPPAVMRLIWGGLFGLYRQRVGDMEVMVERNGEATLRHFTMLEPPLWSAWAALAVMCALCLWLLFRKVRAYEVVKG